MTNIRWFAVFMIGLCAVAYWQTFDFAEGVFAFDLSQAGTYPRLVLAATGGLALWLFLRGERGSDKHADSTVGDPEQTRQTWKELVTPISILASFGLYIILIDFLGFLVSSFMFAVVCQIILIRQLRVKVILYSAMVSALLVAAIWIIFENLLNIVLP